MSFKGKKNIYLCPKCGHGFVTQDLDEGVTPFLTRCITDGCGEYARSMCYAAPQNILADIKPAFVWRKPEDGEELSPSVRAHVERGGLLLRPAAVVIPDDELRAAPTEAESFADAIRSFDRHEKQMKGE